MVPYIGRCALPTTSSSTTTTTCGPKKDKIFTTVYDGIIVAVWFNKKSKSEIYILSDSHHNNLRILWVSLEKRSDIVNPSKLKSSWLIEKISLFDFHKKIVQR